MHTRWLSVLFCVLLWAPAGVQARKQSELWYGYDQVWNAALRMVRVDLRLPITDRDQETGYLLFDYLDHGKRYAGSIEVVRTERDRRPATRVVIHIQGMPSYVEQMLIERLGRKLRDDYGEPIEPPKPPAQKPAEGKPSEEAPPNDPGVEPSTG